MRDHQPMASPSFLGQAALSTSNLANFPPVIRYGVQERSSVTEEDR
jgi:hypothetical protein